jgi:hypothetical protein
VNPYKLLRKPQESDVQQMSSPLPGLRIFRSRRVLGVHKDGKGGDVELLSIAGREFQLEKPDVNLRVDDVLSLTYVVRDVRMGVEARVREILDNVGSCRAKEMLEQAKDAKVRRDIISGTGLLIVEVLDDAELKRFDVRECFRIEPDGDLEARLEFPRRRTESEILDISAGGVRFRYKRVYVDPKVGEINTVCLSIAEQCFFDQVKVRILRVDKCDQDGEFVIAASWCFDEGQKKDISRLMMALEMGEIKSRKQLAAEKEAEEAESLGFSGLARGA